MSPDNKWLRADSALWPAIALVTSILILLYQVRVSPKDFIFDDAYMFIRYADNLLAGSGFSWNGDQNTYGCTSITYVFFVTALRWLFPDLSHYSLLVYGATFWAVAALLLMGLTLNQVAESRALKSSLVRGLWVASGLTAFFAFNLGFRLNVLSGMDTMLSLFANTLLVFCTFKLGQRQTTGWVLLLALAVWLAILTRPDSGIYAFLFPNLVLLVVFRMPFVKIILFNIFAVSFMVVDIVVKYSVFGDPVPLPYYVKQHDFYAGYTGGWYWNPVNYLSDFFAYSFPFMLAIILFIKREWAVPAAALLLPLVLTFLYYFSVTQIMGQFYRFYFPGTVFLVVASFWVFDRYLLSAERDSVAAGFGPLVARRMPYVVIAGVMWLALSSVGSVLYAKLFLPNYSVPWQVASKIRDDKVDKHFRDSTSFDNVSRIAGRLPEGTVIAASEHGKIAAENPHITIIDLMGLHDPEIAHNGISMAYIRSLDPAMIWMPHHDYYFLNRTIVDDPWFKERYYYIPRVFRFGIAVRKDRVDVLEEVVRELDRLYPRYAFEPWLPAFMLSKLSGNE